jgi:hypothetical protein
MTNVAYCFLIEVPRINGILHEKEASERGGRW